MVCCCERRIEDAEDVCQYLSRFPDMIEATEQIARATREHFPGAVLSLQLYRDPEINDSHLILYVRTNEYEPSFIEKLRAVRQQCQEYLSGKQGWLLVTTDFRPAE
jgi:hypothetical protein